MRSLLRLTAEGTRSESYREAVKFCVDLAYVGRDGKEGMTDGPCNQR